MTIIEFLDRRHIPYISSGPNVKRGNVNIHCPYCGDADPSQHMGVNPKTGAFACWRNRQHSGRRPHALVMQLLGCSWEAAQALFTDTSELESVVARLNQRGGSAAEVKVKQYNMVGLRELDGIVHNRFTNYLLQRGYDPEHWPILIDRYGLCCGLFGDLTNRIVWPVVYDDATIGYVGRAIDNSNLRYISLPGPVVKRSILWYDSLLSGGRNLYVTEGPLDAMRLDYIASMSGNPDRSTCLFGVSYTEEQLNLIRELSGAFEQVIILFDTDATGSAIGLDAALVDCHNSRIGAPLPLDVKDPAELSWEQTLRLLHK